MKLCSIRSGSRGNAILLWTQKTGILIDCGISGKAAEAGIRAAGLDPTSLSAILVTHEHSDHISGVGIMSRRFGLPIYANCATWAAMESDLGKLDPSKKRSFDHTDAFCIGDIEITPFSIPHDAEDPVGYRLSGEGKTASVATDIGFLQLELFRAMQGSNAVLLESNHDRNMLEMGHYPLSLKQRIRGNRGHLSNDEAGKAAEFLVRMGVTEVLLGHLSPENNYPLLAEQTVQNILLEAGIRPGRDLHLSNAPGDRLGKICTL